MWRHAVAGFNSGGEQTTRSATNRCCWEIRRATGRKQDSTARIPVGVAECNMCTCSGNGTQERAVQDLLSLVDLYLVYLI